MDEVTLWVVSGILAGGEGIFGFEFSYCKVTKQEPLTRVPEISDTYIRSTKRRGQVPKTSPFVTYS